MTALELGPGNKSERGSGTPIFSRLRLPCRHNRRKQSQYFAEEQERHEHSHHQINLRILGGC